MAGKGKKGAFGAVPARLFEDSGLSSLDMRVMGIVAARDWMSDLRENGAGCFLSFRQIAVIADAHVSSITKSVTKLVEAGYLRTKPFAADRRRKSLVVVYDQERDLAIMDKAKVVGGSANDLQPETSENVGGLANELQEKGGGSTNETPEIVGEANSQVDEIKEENALQDTPQRGERYEVKPRKIFSETARPQNAIAAMAGKIQSIEDDDDIARLLIVIEREAKRDPSIIDSTIYRLLEHTATETKNISIRGHADRLLAMFSPDVSDENLLPSGSNDDPFECPF